MTVAFNARRSKMNPRADARDAVDVRLIFLFFGSGIRTA
jgi:hypothetical protein